MTTELSPDEREKLTDLLRKHFGFYVHPVIEDAFVDAVERIVEARLGPAWDEGHDEGRFNSRCKGNPYRKSATS